jgi:hypothetical protein
MIAVNKGDSPVNPVIAVIEMDSDFVQNDSDS